MFYVLDSEATVIEVGGQWDEFAEQQNAIELVGDSVIGLNANAL